MRANSLSFAAFSAFLLSLGSAQFALAQFNVTTTQPTLNANNAARGGSISVTFNRAVNPATFSATSFKVFGKLSGLFDAPVVIAVGAYLRGFGIIDADGDGDVDITVTNANSSNVSFIRNLGARSFAAPTFFEGGVSGEYGMTAADMNNDGMLDLVIGDRNNEQVSVMRGNGGATFTLASSRPIGGSNWVVVCGNLNNDENIDVSAANSFSNNASTLLENGNGTLQPAVVTPTGGHTVSTDLADLDGDGNLD